MEAWAIRPSEMVISQDAAKLKELIKCLYPAHGPSIIQKIYEFLVVFANLRLWRTVTYKEYLFRRKKWLYSVIFIEIVCGILLLSYGALHGYLAAQNERIKMLQMRVDALELELMKSRNSSNERPPYIYILPKSRPLHSPIPLSYPDLPQFYDVRPTPPVSPPNNLPPFYDSPLLID